MSHLKPWKALDTHHLDVENKAYYIFEKTCHSVTLIQCSTFNHIWSFFLHSSTQTQSLHESQRALSIITFISMNMESLITFTNITWKHYFWYYRSYLISKDNNNTSFPPSLYISTIHIHRWWSMSFIHIISLCMNLGHQPTWYLICIEIILNVYKRHQIPIRGCQTLLTIIPLW